MTLSISLLGGLELRQNQVEKLRLPTRKSEALLAYLVERNGDEVSREAVAELLWPLSGPDQARASLRQELSVLRKSLGETHGERLFASSDRLAFDCAGIDVDIAQLRATIANPTDVISSAEIALRLHKAPFLDALRVRSQPFSDWVWITRQGFEQQALEIGFRALALAEAFLRRDEPGRALELLDELTEFMERTSERYFEPKANDVRERAMLAGQVGATH